MNWIKAVTKIIPLLVAAVQAAESLISGFKEGKKKKEVALDLIKVGIESIEEFAGKDLMDDEKFVALVDQLIDSYVAVQNYIAEHKNDPE